MDLILGRYGPEYRSEVLKVIFAATRAGSSLGLIGLAGTGKSNLLRYAQQPPVVRTYVPDPVEADATHVGSINCKQFSQSKAGFYAALLDALRPAAQRVGLDLPPPSESSGYFDVRDAVRQLCLEKGMRLVVFMDEFESLIQNQPLDLFEELRNIRDEVRTPPHFAYVFVTHRLPHRVVSVVGNQPFENSSLYSLICNHLYAFGPYNERDAREMLEALLRNRQLAVDARMEGLLLGMSGGHAGILAALVEATAPTFALSLNKLIHLGATPGPVNKACERIWRHLHSTERAALRDLVQGKLPPPWLCGFLCKRGLVEDPAAPAIFSQIFARYVQSQGTP